MWMREVSTFALFVGFCKTFEEEKNSKDSRAVLGPGIVKSKREDLLVVFLLFVQVLAIGTGLFQVVFFVHVFIARLFVVNTDVWHLKEKED
jgi:hypothetical protein